jgi:hypothetical protein
MLFAYYSGERNSATMLSNSRTAAASRCARCCGSSPRRGSNSLCKISHRLRQASSLGSARPHSKKSLNSCGYRTEPRRKRSIISATCPGLSIFVLTARGVLSLDSRKDMSRGSRLRQVFQCPNSSRPLFLPSCFRPPRPSFRPSARRPKSASARPGLPRRCTACR